MREHIEPKFSITGLRPETSERTLPQDPRDARALMRGQGHDGPSAGMADGYLQGNLLILPEAEALDFFRFCQRNPKPCPLLAVSDTGDPFLPTLGHDIDIRSDIGSYNIFRDGRKVDEVADIRELWRDDLVSFVIGCSYSFEAAMQAEGLPVRHWETGTIVPMYTSNIETLAAGRFSGPMVVSMRPMRPDQAIRAAEITARFPNAHGTPVHLGDPSAIGIADLARPDDGDAVPVYDDEIPVFWACGVTPQRAVERASLSFAISHTPGCMLITDLKV